MQALGKKFGVTGVDEKRRLAPTPSSGEQTKDGACKLVGINLWIGDYTHLQCVYLTTSAGG
jgi:hypothetical protein